MFGEDQLGIKLEDCPEESREFIIPVGFNISDRGVSHDGKIIIADPIFVSKIFNFRTTFEKNAVPKYEISARVFGWNWIKFQIDSDQISESKKIVAALSRYGVLINSNQARSAVKYFQRFLQINMQLLPKEEFFGYTGWQSETKFLYPNTVANETVFAGQSSLELYRNGSFDRELGLIKRAIIHDGVRLIVVASIASIFLKRCHNRNFTINLYGRSGGGKTAAMRLACSMFGSPNYMIEFNSTINSIEQSATERNDLPLFVNEWQVTDSGKRSEICNSIIHRFGEGVSKRRMNRDLDQIPVKHYRSIMIVTAEEPMINEKSIQGTRARIMEFEFTPVIGTNSANKMIVDYGLCSDIYKGTEESFGHVALDFLDRMMIERTNFSEEYKNWIETFLALCEGSKLQSHLQNLAIIAMADWRFRNWYEEIDSEVAEKKTIEFCSRLLGQLPEKDTLIDSNQLLDLVEDWLNQNQRQFMLAPAKDIYEIPKPYYGFIADENVYYIVPSVLKEFIESKGFSSVKIFQEWARDGRINYNPKQRCYGSRVVDYTKKQKYYIRLSFEKNASNAI